MGRRAKPAWCFRRFDCSLYLRCLNLLARKDPDNLPCTRCDLYNREAENSYTLEEIFGCGMLLREVFNHPRRP